jgi:hypothetical protein
MAFDECWPEQCRLVLVAHPRSLSSASRTEAAAGGSLDWRLLAACTLSALAVSAYSAAGNSAGTNQPDLLTPENWRYRTFGVVDPTLTDPISQWTNDAAGDLLATIWEYAFATQPLNSDSSARISGEVAPDATNRWLQIVVPRDRRRAVNMAGRVSTNLVQWSLGAPGTTVAGDATNRLILRSTTPVKAAPKQFMGAEISLP